MLEEFGKELRKMRKEMGMTIEQLAEELDIDEKQLCKYENGRNEMKGMMLLKLQKLHAEKTKKQEDDLLQQIRKLSPADRMMVEQMIARLAGS